MHPLAQTTAALNLASSSAMLPDIIQRIQADQTKFRVQLLAASREEESSGAFVVAERGQVVRGQRTGHSLVRRYATG